MANPPMEVITFTTNPDHKCQDNLAQDFCQAILSSQASCVRTWIAHGIENRHLLMIFCGHALADWFIDGLSSDAKYDKQHDFYTTLLSNVKFAPFACHPVKLHHVPVNLQALAPVMSHSKAGVLKLTKCHFTPDISCSIQDAWDQLNAKHEQTGFRPWDGYLASLWGWSLKTEKYKEVGETKVWVSLWSWVSMENHLDFMKSQACKDLFADIHEFEAQGLRGVDIWHANVTGGPSK
ncbi:MAG: hypothetical protein Q9159_006781 [Coniocarpon cinnabarinum]